MITVDDCYIRCNNIPVARILPILKLADRRNFEDAIKVLEDKNEYDIDDLIEEFKAKAKAKFQRDGLIDEATLNSIIAEVFE